MRASHSCVERRRIFLPEDSAVDRSKQPRLQLLWSQEFISFKVFGCGFWFLIEPLFSNADEGVGALSLINNLARIFEGTWKVFTQILGMGR